MRLYRRKGSPYWWYRFRTPDGRTIRESSRCRDRRAAAKVGRERRQREEAAAAAAFAGEIQPADIALTDLASQWLASLFAAPMLDAWAAEREEEGCPF